MPTAFGLAQLHPPCVREVAARIGLDPLGQWKKDMARYGQQLKERVGGSEGRTPVCAAPTANAHGWPARWPAVSPVSQATVAGGNGFMERRVSWSGSENGRGVKGTIGIKL